MPVETDQDRLEMLDITEFGVTATVGLNTLPGIFHNPYRDAGDANAPVEASDPVFVCRSLDVTTLGLVIGQSLNILAAPYNIRSIRPDGTGFTELELTKDL